MAIASTPTLLSLDYFAELMEISPWAFNQLDSIPLGDTRTCDVWFQRQYQRMQTLCREDIARAIASAESMIAEHTTYWPAPRFTAGEEMRYPRDREMRNWNWWYNERWKLKSVKTKWGYLISPGIEAYDPISADAAVTLSDTDGDTFDDWFTTAALPTTVTDASEIEAYFIDADRPASMATGDEQRWRIRPVKITLDTAAATVVIEGPIWLLVKPILTIPPYPSKQDPTDIANVFVDSIKVQRRYIDQTDQGEVALEQIPCYSPDCVVIEATACYGERDSKNGVVIPEATETVSWLGPDCACATSYGCNFAPDFCRINYRSGFPLQTDDFYRMNEQHALMVARLAVCLLPEKSCVECSDTTLDFWRSYPFDKPEGSERLILSNNDIDCPFGARRGALWAWRRVLERNARALAGAFY